MHNCLAGYLVKEGSHPIFLPPPKGKQCQISITLSKLVETNLKAKNHFCFSIKVLDPNTNFNKFKFQQIQKLIMHSCCQGQGY